MVGFSRVAQAAGFERAIGFDMGGTSTDVSRFDGRYELEYETEKAGVRVVAPMMAIETVAAGGGSICRFDGVKLVVGPDSAGADPGPACYGRGGPLTMTDVNFLLGKILPERFPFPLDRAAAEARLDALDRRDRRAPAAGATSRSSWPRASSAWPTPTWPRRSARSRWPKAAIRATMCWCRSAAPPANTPAPWRASWASARSCIIPTPACSAPTASAWPTSSAIASPASIETLSRPSAARTGTDVRAARTTKRIAGVLAEGIAGERIESRGSLELRYRGVDASLTIPCRRRTTGERLAEAFCAEHRKLYGYVHEGRELEIVAARVEVRGQSSPPLPRSNRVARAAATSSSARRTPTSTGSSRQTPGLRSRATCSPAIVFAARRSSAKSASTTVIDPRLAGRSPQPAANCCCDAAARQPTPVGQAMSRPTADPVMLEIFNNQFAGHRRADGHHAAQHVEQREREGAARFQLRHLHAQRRPGRQRAAHPGPSGSDGRNGRAASIADNPAHRPRRCVRDQRSVSRRLAPARLTVSRRCTTATGGCLFFTASRAHHAEMGGIVPGSMPPFSRNLAEEGVLIRNFKLLDAGQPRWDELARSCSSPGPYPTRDVDDNLADIAAQVAANHAGAGDLARLVERYSLAVVEAYMRHIQARGRTEKCGRRCARLDAAARYPFVDHLDDGTPIAVTITIAGDSATIDFTGTGPVHAGQSERQPRDHHRGRDVRAALSDRRRHSAQPGRAGAGRNHHCRGAC